MCKSRDSFRTGVIVKNLLLENVITNTYMYVFSGYWLPEVISMNYSKASFISESMEK